MVWPGEFIPVAETSDLILDIGRWVLERSCRQAKEWHDRWPELKDLQISINVAGRQLEQPDFVEQVAEVVRSSGVDPATVVLEVTETTLLQNAEDAIAKLEAIRALGLGVAIDDFGTGYSSLSYLQRFPATAIKIARDFVAVDEADTDSWELASAIVSMGRALRLTSSPRASRNPSSWSGCGSCAAVGPRGITSLGRSRQTSSSCCSRSRGGRSSGPDPPPWSWSTSRRGVRPRPDCRSATGRRQRLGRRTGYAATHRIVPSAHWGPAGLTLAFVVSAARRLSQDPV